MPKGLEDMQANFTDLLDEIQFGLCSVRNGVDIKDNLLLAGSSLVQIPVVVARGIFKPNTRNRIYTELPPENIKPTDEPQQDTTNKRLPTCF